MSVTVIASPKARVIKVLDPTANKIKVVQVAIPGATGPQGETGEQGPPGADGIGIPEGGTAGQILRKVDGTDYNVQWADPSGGSGGGSPGLTNYIASGRKFTVGADLNLTISAGVDAISGEAVERAENILELHARRAQLVYDTLAGATGIIDAAFPAADAGTVCRWDFSNWDGVSAIPSTVGNNNLIPNGTLTREVGWAGDYAVKGDGLTGYLVSANSTGFPTGASAREIDLLVTVNNTANTVTWLCYGDGSNYVQIRRNAKKIELAFTGAANDTQYEVESGKTYLVTLAYSGSKFSLSINGVLVYTLNLVVNTAAGVLNLFRYLSGGQYADDTIHYVELRNALRTPAQIAAISNALLLPCRYYPDTAVNEYTDIRAILPADSIALGFVRTDEDSIVEYNDTDYKFGRREGAMGGNRKRFYGYAAVSTNMVVPWVNVFGTERIKITQIRFKKYLSDAKHSLIDTVYSSNNFGSYVKEISNSTIIVQTGTSAVISDVNSYTNVNETTGYIAIDAEVIE